MRAAAEDLAVEFVRTRGAFGFEVSAGSSGSLGVKIREGAPFDVFLAADEDTPRRLVQAGALSAGSVVVYARGHLVLWARAESPLAGIEQAVDALRDSRIRNIAIASPRLAPYGRAAQSFLDQSGLFEALGPKLATAENAEQAAQFALTGAADLAFIPRSLSMTLRDRGHEWKLDDDSYPPFLHAGGVVARSSQASLAHEFMAFTLSPAGQAILSRHGLGRE